MIKVALIQCPAWTAETPPIGIAYLAAYLKNKSYDVTCFDFNINAYNCMPKYQYLWDSREYHWIGKNPSFLLKKRIKRWVRMVLDSEASLIGFSIYSSSRQISVEMARRIKSEDKNRIIIFGGAECIRSSNLSSLLNEDVADAIVIGEGEETLFKLVEMLNKSGKIKNCPGTILKCNGKYIDCGPRPPIKNLDKLPYPDFSDFPLKKYTNPNAIPILGSRGCPFRCEFCSDHQFWQQFRYRSGENIFNEMKIRFNEGYTEFKFCDLIVNGNISQLEKLADLIIRDNEMRKISWSGQFKCRPEMTYSLLRKLRKSGLGYIAYGVESGSQTMLNKMKKDVKIKTIEKNLRDTYKAGINVHVNLIVGFPGENYKTFKETLNFLRRNKDFIYVVEVNQLNLRPGSPLTENQEKYGILKTSPSIGDWVLADGRNTPEWRRKLCYRIYRLCESLGIKIKYNPVTEFYIPMINFYFKKGLYKKLYRIATDAIMDLNTKLNIEKYNLLLKEEELQRMKKWSKL